MAYISLPDSVPGILGLYAAFPATGKLLLLFTQQLLRGESSLTLGERELIAACVSRANSCEFCRQVHTAAAKELLSEFGIVDMDKVVYGQDTSKLTEKVRSLIDIALAVQLDGRSVSQAHIDAARSAGADDKAIHDTVLIAAAFCMFNRYVDGLATWTPKDQEIYDYFGKKIAIYGYQMSS